ncbi:MAG: thiamine pyrophosphate-dependent dehydrogenase E1 component subunit alpha [Candidatus Methanomethylicaceae archaeon]
MPLDREKLLDLYKKMVLTRVIESKHEKLLREGAISLMAHSGLGQEAAGVGVTGPLHREDYLFGTHRGVAEYIGKGMCPKDIWAEYYGKRTGPCRGKGTLHLADRKVGIPGLVSSLGMDFGIAVGTALASKKLGTGQVTLLYVGEGTMNQGDAHPAMVMASLWKVPVIFACCTNEWIEFCPFKEHFPTKDVAPRGSAYNIPWEIVDGNDVEAVYEASKRAVDRARNGGGPSLIELKTYRRALHYSGDPGGYMNPEEIKAWAKKDPIDRCRNNLLSRGFLTEAQDKEIWREAEKEVDEAVRSAQMAPDPTPEDLYTDLYSEEWRI